MTISNTADTGQFLALMADIETGRDEPEPHEAVREGFRIADDIYRQALESSPQMVADRLLAMAERSCMPLNRAMLRIAAAMLIQHAGVIGKPTNARDYQRAVGVNPNRE